MSIPYTMVFSVGLEAEEATENVVNDKVYEQLFKSVEEAINRVRMENPGVSITARCTPYAFVAEEINI